MLDKIDYRNYLSLDNGKGILLNKSDVEILNKYGFDYKKYTDLNNLIFDIDNFINTSYDELEDLENVLIRISEIYYYNQVNK